MVIVADAKSADCDSAVIRFLSQQDIALTPNRVTLLSGGKEKFDDLFQCIQQAKHHIHLEYFNFRNDSIAGRLFDLLSEKARQGVEVRAVYDAFGNWSNTIPLKRKQLDTIRRNGIEIHPFDPIYFPVINHIFCRDHRKIVIIDGQVGYIGGVNVADYYIKGLPEIGRWRDMHVRIEGAAVHSLQKAFVAIWHDITQQTIDGSFYFPPCDTIGETSVAIVHRIPKKLPRQLEQTYLQSIRSARHSIRIVNPYFLPTPAIKRELYKALARKVKVEIMISAKLDIKLTPDGVFHVAHKLMKKGADIYIYTAGLHHSKIMTVDDQFCTVGSANLDYRSLRHDYEANAWIFDADVTNDLNAIFDADKKDSIRMTPEFWSNRTLWKRFVGWIAYALSPVL